MAKSKSVATVNNNSLAKAINQINAKMKIMATIYDFSPEAPAGEDFTANEWAAVLREVADEIGNLST